jgi:Transglycosylase SLT domain
MVRFKPRRLSRGAAKDLQNVGSIRAWRRSLLMVIAAATIPLAGPTARAQFLAAVARGDVAKIKLLIRQNAASAETVRFADNRDHPVTVVRGKRPSSGLPGAPGSDGIVTFAGGQKMPAAKPLITRETTAVLPVPPTLGAAEQVVVFASAGNRPITVLRGMLPATPIDRDSPVVASDPCLDRLGACGAELDRVAFAVDGAESSHGADPGMWRADLNGPQGPMQVSAAAAIDAGGGDRFDLMENRQLGRAYLARLFRRYGNWLDTVAAYNWGPGNMDLWIAQGRPLRGLPSEVELYRDRVFRDGGFRQEYGQSFSRIGGPFPTH